MTRSLARALLVLFALATLSACGVPSGPSGPSEPFVAHFPDEGPGTWTPPPTTLPPPVFPEVPVWTQDAFPFQRVALYGSFPSGIARLGSTLFTTDADAVEAAGAWVVPIDVSGPAPVLSAHYQSTLVQASYLVDSAGRPGDASAPIGFGFYLNDLRVVSDTLGFVLANAGGSDSAPTLSNLVVIDPTAGTVRQVVDLATVVFGFGPLLDSTNAPVPGEAFRQSGAEGIEFVPTGPGRGRLFVAMSNFLFGAPSYGAVKYPGTVQVFDVDETAPAPVTPRPAGALATTTFLTHDYNPVALTWIAAAGGQDRILVTNAGTTAYDASFHLVPVTPASVEAFDAASFTLLGRFELGLAGLSGAAPAIGHDAAGHAVAFFASSVRGEAYLLRIDGLTGASIDASKVAVLRGPSNGIPIDTAAAGSPGGNVEGIGLSADGLTLVLSGFGDLFAYPTPTPGRLYALSLPADLVGSPAFPVTFLPGTSQVVTAPGRTLGALVIAPEDPAGPEVYVAVGGAIAADTGLGAGPASIGTLETFGLVR